MNFTFILILKATAILSISSILLFAFRKSSASLRHWIISLTLIGLLILPFFTASLPTWEIETPAIEAMQELPLLEGLVIEPQETAMSYKEISPAKAIQNNPESITSTNHSTKALPWAKIIFTLWITGCLLILTRLFVGIYRIRKLTQAATPFKTSNQFDKFRLLSSTKIQTPMTWGFFHPVILLPANATDWTPQTLNTVIQHEAAHIQRGDYLVHILSWFSVAVYWFHPLVWWFKNSQQIEREKACDEYVLRSGLSQQEYAEQLVFVARSLSGHTPFRTALPMAQFAEIKHRLLAILAFQVERFRFTKLNQFQWGSFYAGSILLLAILTPVKPTTLMEYIAPNHPITEMLQEETKEQIAIIASDKIDAPVSTIEEKLNPNRNAPEQLNPVPKIKTSTVQLATPNHLRTVRLPNIVRSTFASEMVTTSEASKKAYYGKWTEGRSTFEVWTVGDIIHSPELPYLEAATPDDMVIIEEVRKSIFGEKRFRLIITKAPFNGGLIVSFLDGKPNSWNGSYKENDPMFLYYEEDEFRFLGNQKSKWINANLEELSNNVYMAGRDKNQWKAIDEQDSKIQKYREMKAHQFRTYDDLPLNDFEHLPYWKNKRDLENPPFDFTSVPVAPMNENVQTKSSRIRKVGGTKKRKSASGGNAFNIGDKYGSAIRKIPDGALLKNFNFHLKYMDFNSITFVLHLYQIDAQGIQQRLNDIPIVFDSTAKDWNQVDLTKYNIQAKGDILAMLEIVETDGNFGQDFLLFSMSNRKYISFHEQTGKDWGFQEFDLAWYFEVFD